MINIKISLAQNTVEFQQLPGENVSTQSITYAIKQDSVGYVWIASEEGVLRHNSIEYKIYNTYKGLPKSVGNRTTSLLIDSKQRVWAGLEKGLCLYDENMDEFRLVGKKSEINPSLINTIIEDKKGNIWVGGFNGLWKYDVFEEEPKLTRIIHNQPIEELFIFEDHFFIGTQKGIFIFDTENSILKRLEIEGISSNISHVGSIGDQVMLGTKSGDIVSISKDLKTIKKIDLAVKLINPITDIVQGNSQDILIATDGDGLYRISKDFKILDHNVEDSDDETSLTSNGIYDLEFGNEDILWIATYGGGVNYFDFDKLPFQQIQHQLNNKNSLMTNFTRAISKDINENIWFGTRKGISIWDPKNRKWKHITDLSGKDHGNKDIILALQKDGDHMWVGTYNNGIFKVNVNTYQITNFNEILSEGQVLKKVYALFKDVNDNIWSGGIESDLTVFKNKKITQTYPIRQVKNITQTRGGDILVSGRSGVHRINPITKEFKLIEQLQADTDELIYSTINAVHQNKNNSLVLGTNGEGLVFYNQKSGAIRKLGITSGMPSDIVQGIVMQDDNLIWASTTRGLAQVILSPSDTIINVFNQRDGLASTEFNYGSFAKLNDSLFAFGGVDGVSLFNPNKIIGKDHRPSIVFDAFKLFNKNVEPNSKTLSKHINVTDKIYLKNNENSIEIHFTGILHGSSSQVRYVWKMEGFDQEWSSPTPINFATYTNLTSGNYVFKVKALNKYGNYGQERSIALDVKSPWWVTNTAFFLYALALALALLAIIHFTSVIVKKKNADEQIEFFNNITHEIKTPLTILISSLDNVTENIDSGEDSRKRIKTTVKRINSLFEQMLNFQKVTSTDGLLQDITPIKLNTHINMRINNFKPLTKERNINIVLNNQWSDEFFYFDKDILDKILLNLLSNAIKYSFEDGNIIVNLSKDISGELKIEVIDEGLGIPKDQQKFILKHYYRARNVMNSQRPGTGLGLMMVKKLLDRTGGSITFQSFENKGTTFTVFLKNKVEKYNEIKASKEDTVSAATLETEDQAELDEFSDSKILIVEDNDELREVLVNTLGVYFQMYEAKNGKEGLDMASHFFPDIILTDLIMPEMDGMQMARQLKDDINLNHIPVFMLTVLQNSEQKLESIESGVSEYIEKPVDIKFLLAKMINALKWQKNLREKYVHDNDTETATLFRNKKDQEFLENLKNTVIEHIENKEFSVHDLSKSVGMSRTSLYMKLKNLVALSPQDFIIHTKLKYAKDLLIKGELSIKEIAYSSGFSNPKYFSTSFKKFYKITPSGFLDSLQK